ncbi:MAG: flippase-like domain-containing protein [Candidatus Fermentibacteraceae bacterium]|nr:flippase-like domain-containing protein [Candidatus Fermentibacteraceae bacterium]
MNSRRIKKGLVFFCIITLVSLTVLFVLTRSQGLLVAFSNYDLRYLSVTFILLLVDVALGSYRNHVFMKKLDGSVDFMTSLRANLANTFVGAVTPSQGGGGPAQFYVYHRKGASIGQAVFVAAFNYLSTLIVFISGAVLALLLLSDRFQGRFDGLILLCFIVFSTEFALLTLALSRPSLFIRLLGGITTRLLRKSPGLGRRMARLTDRISMEIGAFRDSSRDFFSRNILMIPLSLFLTLVLYLNKYVIAYTVLLGMGIQSDFMTVIAIQAILMCIIYFSPSPGGSGIAEFSTAALMSTLIPESRLGIFSLLQRSFLLYLPMLMGAFVIFHELRVLASGIGTDRQIGDPAVGSPV